MAAAIVFLRISQPPRSCWWEYPAVYAASKAAIELFTAVTTKEVGGREITDRLTLDIGDRLAISITSSRSRFMYPEVSNN
ncbi:hypothetical protein [Chamaesiphon sp. OTE_75_metabat_556]|uniref:hypothetical protein n=1 Tax=Chamaesiphon sp. OTE_75_metabat_556 TaxID=2964692 RepID=UPI00286C9C35|nr:hypothetical protein [Chamaesiphon sp. OTE_75_metabat_556]